MITSAHLYLVCFVLKCHTLYRMFLYDRGGQIASLFAVKWPKRAHQRKIGLWGTKKCKFKIHSEKMQILIAFILVI